MMRSRRLFPLSSELECSKTGMPAMEPEEWEEFEIMVEGEFFEGDAGLCIGQANMRNLVLPSPLPNKPQWTSDMFQAIPCGRQRPGLWEVESGKWDVFQVFRPPKLENLVRVSS